MSLDERGIFLEIRGYPFGIPNDMMSPDKKGGELDAYNPPHQAPTDAA